MKRRALLQGLVALPLSAAVSGAVAQSGGERARRAIREGGFRVGASVKSITPNAKLLNKPLYMGGGSAWPARISGVGDLITCRAMAVGDDAGSVIVVVSLDLVFLDESLTADLREHLYSSYRIPRANVLVSITHTHFAPVSMDVVTYPQHAKPDPDFLALVRRATLAAADEALASQSSASIYFARGAVDVGRNRHLVAGGHYGQAYDRTLDVIYARDEEGQFRVAVLMHGCHPVTAGQESPTRISADFPGVVRNRVENHMARLNLHRGPWPTTLYLQGYAGTIVPKPGLTRNGIGEIIASEAIRLLSTDPAPLRGSVGGALIQQAFALEPPNEEKKAQARQEKHPVLDRWLAVYDHVPSSADAVLPTQIQCLTIGDPITRWRVLASSHEVVAEYSPLIRAIVPSDHLPGEHLSLVAYANSSSSYLPNRTVRDFPLCSTPLCGSMVHPLGESGNYEGGFSFIEAYGLPGRVRNTIQEDFLDANIALLDSTWQAIGDAPSEVLALCTAGEAFVATTRSGKCYFAHREVRPLRWQPFFEWGVAGDIAGIAFGTDGTFGERLFVATAGPAGRLYSASLELGRVVRATSRASDIGHAGNVQALGMPDDPPTGLGSDFNIYATVTSQLIFRRSVVPREIPWEAIGHANDIIGIAFFDRLIVALAAANGDRPASLWWRIRDVVDGPWSRFASAHGIRAMTGANQYLYGLHSDGRVMSRKPWA